MFKKGDTLIEVTLAVGIFSMIAIAVASLMNHGTADAQLALENTLAREEIDAQADALRYIHNAYAANKEGETQPATALWKRITSDENVIDLNGISEKDRESITKYAPTTCENAMKNITKGAFVLNTRNLGLGADAYVPLSTFNQASTYPRLVFNNSSDKLIENLDSSELNRAEGLYVIAVKDPDSTNIVGEKEKSAYYDFYIRSCWYGAGEKTPSTIHTVIRLHDASVIKDIITRAYDVKNAGDKIATITTMAGKRDYRLKNDGGAWVGYACHKHDGRQYVGPVLISDLDKKAVSFENNKDNIWQTNDKGIGDLGNNYYHGSFEMWMQIDDCSNAKSAISDAKGYKAVIPIVEGDGPAAVKQAAKRILKERGISK